MIFFYRTQNLDRYTHGVMTDVLIFNIFIGLLKHMSRYYVTFKSNTLGKA